MDAVHKTDVDSVGLEGNMREAQVRQCLSAPEVEAEDFSPSPHLYPRRHRHQPTMLTYNILGFRVRGVSHTSHLIDEPKGCALM